MAVAAAIEEKYQTLLRWSKELSLLASCQELLNWDQETYMPRAGVQNRGSQLALLAGLHHQKATDPRMGELLAELEGSSLAADPCSPAAVNIRELRRLYDRRARLPRALVEELVRTTTIAQQEWSIAHQDSDYARFRPWLEAILTLKREEAQALGYRKCAYDALLEEHEPGVCSEEIGSLLEALRKELLPLFHEIAGARRRPREAILRREFALERQRVFTEAVATELGFDFHGGRLDVALHPFQARIGPGDCRIATLYRADNFCQGFFAAIHEVGHALYDQGLEPEHHGTPMGEAASLSLHESQARLWENNVGRSLPFWTHFYPLAKEIFHDTLHDVSLKDFNFAVSRVAPTFIRSQADEVTYHLHVLVRFEIERALLAGDLSASDLPGAWAEGYRRYLGITPPDDRQGCLQDGHWSAGMFAYFPTYTLGSVFAAQLFSKARDELADLDGQISRGEFVHLLTWLRDRVHRHGHRHRATALIEQATGSPPTHRALTDVLRRKYRPLYGL